MNYFSQNGNLFPESESLSRAARFGDGIFETIAVVYGKLIWAEAHIQRLIKGARFIQLELPIDWSENWLYQQIDDLLKINNVQNGKVRIQLFREGKGAFKPQTDQATTVIEVMPDVSVWQQEPIRMVGIFDSVLLSRNNLSDYKTCNSLAYVLAARFAAKNQWEDAILLHSDRSIAECSSSNLFAVIGESWFTPTLSSGCLPGVFRQKLISFLQKNNISIQENKWEVSWLKQEVQELYSVSSVQGMRSILSIKGHNRTFASLKSETAPFVKSYFSTEIGV